jgi:putative membrane protein
LLSCSGLRLASTHQSNKELTVSYSALHVPSLVSLNEADLRDYLAEERTFLAWIRTGIALMGLGLVVAHFGIFLDKPYLTQHTSGFRPHELSLWFGGALIGIGATANLFSARRYMRLVGELSRGQFVHRSVSREGVAVAMFLALLGIAMTFCMSWS